MQHPLTVLYTPLPQGSTAELVAWRCAFETALEPWLDARQWKHVNRFGRAAWQQDASIADAENCGPTPCGQNIIEAALSRLLARALLVTATARHHRGGPLPQTGMDTRGRPLLSGWQAAFSHSGRAAFCALTPAGAAASATLGLDAEALTSAPPDASAFSQREYSALLTLHQQYRGRESLRRWTVKEAMLKAAGLGLGMQPAQIPTGRSGQRAGLWRGPLGLLCWRTLACPGHWLCVAQAGHVPTAQIFLQRQNPPTLLRRLAALRPQP